MKANTLMMELCSSHHALLTTGTTTNNSDTATSVQSSKDPVSSENSNEKVGYDVERRDLDFLSKYAENPFQSSIPFSPIEYVSILNDAIFFNKNLILCQNFEYLDKMTIVNFSNSKSLQEGTKGKMTIDVWPFLTTKRSDDESLTVGEYNFEPSTILTLQLGYILSRVKEVWQKHCRLRILSAVESSDLVEDETRRINAILNDCRITGDFSVLVLPMESSDKFKEWKSTVVNSKAPSLAHQQSVYSLDYPHRYAIYADLVQSCSRNTACVFFPCIKPPQRAETESDQDFGKRANDFLMSLNLLSSQLPPSAFIYASELVVSTEL